MAAKTKDSTRLRRSDWLGAALKLLADQGISGVTIEHLAGNLGVTRGSFYHHFENRDDLLGEMLDYWEQTSTIIVRDEVRSLGLDPRNSLLALSGIIRRRGASDYDVAFRAWALHDPMARKVVQETDEVRLSYVRGLFGEMGFKGLDAENRARLFLCYEMSEPALFADQTPEMKDNLVVERVRFLTGDRGSD